MAIILHQRQHLMTQGKEQEPGSPPGGFTSTMACVVPGHCGALRNKPAYVKKKKQAPLKAEEMCVCGLAGVGLACSTHQK